MANELVRFSVGSDDFQMSYLTGRKALSLSYRLAKYVGPSLAAMAVTKNAEEVDLETAARTFFDNCTEKEFTEFAEEMFKHLLINNRSGEAYWETFFVGKPMHMYTVLVECVKRQFADFFEKFPDLGNVVKSQAKATLID